MRALRPSPPRARAAVAVGLAIHALHGLTGFGGRLIDWLVVQGIYNALILLAIVVVAAQARREPAERRAWGLIAAGMAAGGLGELSWSLGLGNPDGAPMLGDVAYLAYYPLMLAGCVRLAQRSNDRRSWASWLDALAATLAVAAAGAGFLLDASTSTAGSGLTEVLAFAYPALDTTLIAVVVGLAASQRWRLGRRWAILGAGILVSGLADVVFYAKVSAGGYTEGGVVDSLWPAGMLLIALSSTLPPERVALPRAPTLLLPLGLALVALAVLVTDHFRAVPTAAIALACGALVAILLRALLAFRENEAMLARSQIEALSDGLTGLPNRRALALRLEQPVDADAPCTLLLFDLDGFKLYNDTFGHPAGDALLARLAQRLREAVEGEGTAYRMGGDEFCALVRGDPVSSVRVELALREYGEGFDVGASFGAVALPREAADATSALRIADQRLYAGKERRRASAGAQASDALLRVLGEREPGLYDHHHDVADLALAVSRHLGLGPDQVQEISRAAELHDIGKVALPDLILRKEGPLTPDERAFVEQHTIVGERILAAAPALRGVSRIVRASHERWDGTGYPDRLVRAAIPLGARIVAACDAYDAMISVRPYQGPVPPAYALAELRRCSGSQFDPEVVAALVACVERDQSQRSSKSSSPTQRTTRPGTPMTTARGGTSLVTTEPAAT